MTIVCSNATTLSLLIGVTLGSPLIIFAHQIAHFLPGSISSLQVIYLASSLIFCNVLSIQLNWLRLKEKVVEFVLVSFLRSLLQAALLVLTLYLGYGVTGIMFATAVTTSAMVLYFIFFQFDGSLRFDPLIQKKLFLFGLPLSFNGMAEFILMSLSNWWLAYDMGAAKMALFALAMKFSMMISFAIQPYYMWWEPMRYKQLSRPDGRAYIAKTSELGVALCFIAANLTVIGSSLIILWFIPASYHYSISYLPISCYILTLKFAADMMSTGLFLEKPNYIMYINTAMAILTIIGFYFFIPLWHAWGALLVLHSTLGLRWVAYVYYSQKQLWLPYRYSRLLPFTLLSELFGISIHWMTDSIDYLVIGGGLILIQVLLAYMLQLLPKITLWVKPL